MRRKWSFPLLFLLAVLMLVASGCSGDPTLNALDPQGTAGEKSLDLMKMSIMVMTFVFTVVMAIYIWVIIRYRKRKNKEVMPEQVHGSTKLEIIWTVIPIVLLTALAVPTVRYTFDLAETPKPNEKAVRINVTGYQYWWEFEYPDYGFTTAQEMVIPIDTKIELTIQGKDVIHSFWVPALSGKIDVIPGQVNKLPMDAKKPGFYQGKCAELCGPGHALMDFRVYAKSEAEFNQWVKQMTAPPAEQKSATVQAGEEVFKQNCMACHAGMNEEYKGPDLSKFATRTTVGGVLENNRSNLKKWITNPSAVKPGSKMPAIDYLSDQELNSLMDYLESRK